MHTFALRRCVSFALAFFLVLIVASGQAQPAASGYPSRPITLVVPYPPGGSNDNTARLLGRQLSEALGQPVILDNRGGAGGTLGAEYVARARPDGYTVLYVSSSFLTAAAVMTRLPYDPLKDFAPIARISQSQFVICVPNQFPATTLKQFIDYAKAHPNEISYGTSGVGSINHFATEALADAAGISLVHVPYRGMAPALQDLAGGHLPLVVGSVSSTLAQVKGGRVRALAVTGNLPVPQFKGVPMASSVLPGFSFISSGSGLLAPAGTPRAILDRLASEVAKALQDPTLLSALELEGVTPAPMGAEAFTKALGVDLERYKALARKNDIRAE